MNNEIKSKYFTNSLEANKKNPKLTWKLINESNSASASSHKTISNIRVGEEIIDTPKDIAEIFNSQFASVGEKLASAVEPDIYVEPAETTFSMKSPAINAVYKK